MTKDKALKLALEALELHLIHHEHGCVYLDPAVTAIKEALAQDDQLTEKEKISREMTAEIVAARTLAQPERSGCTAGKDEECTNRHCATKCPAMEERSPQPTQEPVAWMHEWADGERIPLMHGADERDADKPISVRPLVYGDTAPPKPEQDPVATNWSVYNTGAEVWGGLSLADAMEEMSPDRLERGWSAVCVVNKDNPPTYTTPPKAQNFCSRCGKRIPDLTTIHTCTPPRGLEMT